MRAPSTKKKTRIGEIFGGMFSFARKNQYEEVEGMPECKDTADCGSKLLLHIHQLNNEVELCAKRREDMTEMVNVMNRTLRDDQAARAKAQAAYAEWLKRMWNQNKQMVEELSRYAEQEKENTRLSQEVSISSAEISRLSAQLSRLQRVKEEVQSELEGLKGGDQHGYHACSDTLTKLTDGLKSRGIQVPELD